MNSKTDIIEDITSCFLSLVAGRKSHVGGGCIEDAICKCDVAVAGMAVTRLSYTCVMNLTTIIEYVATFVKRLATISGSTIFSISSAIQPGSGEINFSRIAFTVAFAALALAAGLALALAAAALALALALLTLAGLVVHTDLLQTRHVLGISKSPAAGILL